MKKLTFLSIFIVPFIVFVSCTSTRSTIKYPSDLEATGRGSCSVDFVLYHIADFRLLYCNEQTLSNRIKEGVCVIDYAGHTGSHVMIKVKPASSLGAILEQSGNKWLERWHGQPNLRVITQRSILADTEPDQFLKMKIQPGDFIVVLPVD